jgi:hypothetical protein
MTRLICGLLIVVLCLLLSCNRGSQTPELVERKLQTPPVGPQTEPATSESNIGFVRDEQEAIEIAVKAWIPIYGKEKIEGEKPYHAELEDGVWTVNGSLPEAPKGSIAIGGVAIARISQKDGKVIETGHTK